MRFSDDKTILKAMEYINEQNQDYYNRTGRRKKHLTVTYGCQMNVHDSEKLNGMLEAMGYISTDNREDADLIIYNTCCVRENAENRVYGNVGALAPLKQDKPDLMIAVCGCMMQQEGMAEHIAERFPFVDVVFGTHNLHQFPNLLLEAMQSNLTIVEVLDDNESIVEDMPIERSKGISAWVTIMHGCNNFCSYCIVPYVRGREKSRGPIDILKEVESIAQQGYKEITLLGQNVNSYGKDLAEQYLFPDLLRDINKIDGIERIRFMTSHPKDLSDDLIKAMGDCEKICEHLHLPVQSGSNKILEKMNRKYTREQYLQLISRVREGVPNIAITTDIIVGFPGETEEDFADTLDLVRAAQFDSAFTFIYSPRQGTRAADMDDQVDIDIKKERLSRLTDVQKEISGRKNLLFKDRIVEVLVEGASKNDPDTLSGRTRDNRLVNFKGDPKLIGQLAHVKITNPKFWTLDGSAI